MDEMNASEMAVLEEMFRVEFAGLCAYVQGPMEYGVWGCMVFPSFKIKSSNTREQHPVLNDLTLNLGIFLLSIDRA